MGEEREGKCMGEEGQGSPFYYGGVIVRVEERDLPSYQPAYHTVYCWAGHWQLVLVS